MEDSFLTLLGAYTSAPDWIRTAVGGAYGALPLSLRLGPAFGRFLKLFEDPPAAAQYARAARMLDLLEGNGVIGQADGSKPREILIDGGSVPASDKKKDVQYDDEIDDQKIRDHWRT